MANRIAGITVEIGGDTTKLSKALESVNKKIRSTQTQLKDVERLLKLDPTNTEPLAQKQHLLTDAVSATSEKLDTLRTTAKQAQHPLEQGDISQAQFDALQREIIATEQALRGYNDELEELARVSDDTTDSLNRAGDSADNADSRCSGFLSHLWCIQQKRPNCIISHIDAAVGDVLINRLYNRFTRCQLFQKHMGFVAAIHNLIFSMIQQHSSWKT